MKRRDLLGLGGMTLVGATLLPASVRAQTPKRGGTIALRLWDPPHFDPYLQVSYKTHIVFWEHEIGVDRPPARSSSNSCRMSWSGSSTGRCVRELSADRLPERPHDPPCPMRHISA